MATQHAKTPFGSQATPPTPQELAARNERYDSEKRAQLQRELEKLRDRTGKLRAATTAAPVETGQLPDRTKELRALAHSVRRAAQRVRRDMGLTADASGKAAAAAESSGRLDFREQLAADAARIDALAQSLAHLAAEASTTLPVNAVRNVQEIERLARRMEKQLRRDDSRR